MAIPYIIKPKGDLTFFFRGENHVVPADHPNRSKIEDQVKRGITAGLDELLNVAKAILRFAGTNVSIVNGQVFYAGQPVHQTLTDRLVALMRDGYSFEPLARFIDNLYQNPSEDSIAETYLFLENHGLPITEDGCFLAYKAVRNNYMDIYKGEFRNQVGDKPTMQRTKVDSNYNRDCSAGLHVGALDYVVQYGHFTKGEVPRVGGNRLMIVKVNPANVVSVPKYEGHPKMRVWTYEVVDEIKDVVTELAKVVYTPAALPATPSDSRDWGTDEDDDSEDYDSSEYDSYYTQGYNDRSNGRPRGATLSGTEDSFQKDAYHEGYDDSIADGN